MGGKARALHRLQREGFRVPPFFVVAADDVLDPAVLAERCAALAAGRASCTFAVRSSAADEDGARTSFAGMFESYLFVPQHDVAARVEQVRRSAQTPRVAAYAERLGAPIPAAPDAIVQRMIDAEVSGVAFGRNPVDGSDRVVVAAARGVGAALVGGECDADTFCVDRDGTFASRTLAAAPAASAGAVVDDDRVREIAALTRAIGRRFGTPQDVEWAVAGGVLHVLQARPVTTPPGTLWDNSNISESYGGIVSPLTFSFAQHAYAGAYRQFMRALALPPRTIAAHDEALAQMLGLVHGRMYYNLLVWYRLLALVPGFRFNRRFMEEMMGVSERLTGERARELAAGPSTRDAVAAARTIAALVRRYVLLPRDIARFHRTIDAALAEPVAPDASLAELGAAFDRLERELLERWEAPLVNDFFAMIFYGLLARAASSWCGGGALHNDLLCAEGGMVSAEPARRVRELAALARRRSPAFEAELRAYLERFGDRCQSELKLESLTLHDDPTPLLQAIARLAADDPAPQTTPDRAARVRRAAEDTVRRSLRARPVRRLLFGSVLAHARARIRDRENLRFERTRVFGRVRVIVTAMGRELFRAGWLAEPRDVFFLELGELRAAVADAALRPALAARVAERRAAYARFAQEPPPPGRFVAIGATVPAPERACADAGGDERTGLGCCPGVVRARVRVVADPCAPLQPGEILVAEHTDPGWVVLFPAAAGILVERGSVLSHAAIVSREMGVPSVVGIAGLTRWLRDGDLVELDGRSGTVRRLESAIGSSTDARADAA